MHRKAALLLFTAVLSICFSRIAAQPPFQWVKATPGFPTPTTVSSNTPSALMVNRYGEVYLFGGFGTAMDMDQGPAVDSLKATAQQGYQASYACKYSSAGQLIWARNIGTGKWTAAYAAKDGYWYAGGNVAVDSMGFGYSTDTLSTQGAFIAKYDEQDHLQWAKSLPGSGNIWAIKADSNGNVFVAGTFMGSIDLDPAHPATAVLTSGVLNAFVAKYDGDGNFIWVRHLTGGNGTKAAGLDLDPAGNVLATGYTYGLAQFMDTGAVYRSMMCGGGYDAFVVKYNTDGALLWTRDLGGTGHDYGIGIATDAAGNAYVTGQYAISMMVDTAANLSLNTGAGSISGYLVKLKANNGHPIWAKSYGCDTGFNKFAWTVAVTVDDTNNVYMTGMFQNSVVLNPAAAPLPGHSTHMNSAEYYVLKLDSAGGYKWHIQTYSKWDDQASLLHLDAENNVYVAGYISDTTDFDLSGPGGLVGFPMPNPNWIPVSFLVKYGHPPVGEGLNNIANSGGYRLFPNPVSDELILLNPGISSTSTITVLDLLGRTCKVSIRSQNGEARIDTRALRAGVYILQCSDNNATPYRSKFIKE